MLPATLMNDLALSDALASSFNRGLADDLAAQGYATRALLSADTCRALASTYDDEARFRKRVVMEQHGYGQGEYKYFAYPLPDLVAALRAALYPPLAVVANAWLRTLGETETLPGTLDQYLARCHAAGQTRPTPLLLRYGPGGFNCLHQDLYGDLVFPLQVAVLLDQPGQDFAGGEFIMVEQRPRAQSRPIVVPLRQGEGVIFPVHHRPAVGTRGPYRLTMRHGVSRIHSGQRHTLGLIFHDAT
ncbi:MAG TPA: 2OG-Fe(II) oxygenase [Rhodopila sp.]